MFGAIFKRAQASVDNAIDQAVNRAIVVVPFIIGLGFATAAFSVWLNRELGPETANLVLAAVFGLIGLVAYAYMRLRQPTTSAAGTDEPVGNTDEAPSQASAASGMAAVDRELLMAVLSTAGPVAAPALFRMLARNLPVVLVIIAAIFVLSRSAGSDQTVAADPQG